MVSDPQLISDPGYGLNRPLQRRQRPAHVIQELEELNRQPRGVVLQRARETDQIKGLTRETLVSLARTFHQRGDSEAVRIILDALIARVSGVLRRKLASWHVHAADKEDLQRHVIVGLCGYWLDAKDGEELWECNFTTPFQLRTLTLIDGFFPKTVRATSFQAFYDDGEETGMEKDIADPESMAPFETILQNLPERAALQALADHNPSWGRVIHDKYVAGYTEEEIALRYGVTSRTIRNWISEARDFLQAQVSRQAEVERQPQSVKEGA